MSPIPKELFDPLKSERPECRCLRKMRTQILEVSGEPEGAEYLARIDESYVKLGCVDERIKLLEQRIAILEDLEKTGEASPQMIKERARYEVELENLKKTFKELI
jgi:hypothetical protein